ncbi:MAG: PASTA domain-containing protein [Clostridia bacterium]|nr:PASTA domain-containing protein [Clostridia bacterium]
MKKSRKIQKINFNNKKALTIFFICIVLIFVLLLVRICFLQFVQGSVLKSKANAQQTTTRTIAANRGTIYDRNGKVLASSAHVDIVSVNPNSILYSDDTEVPKEILASKFSELFSLDYTETLNKLNEDSKYVVITRKADSNSVTSLKAWMKECKITSGINIDSTINRYYPYNNLASNLIGFTGSNTHGSWGLEYTLDSILAGTDGKVVMLTDSVNSEIPNQEKTYIEAKDGSSVYLTIDFKVQSVCEKYLAQAVSDNKADGGTVIVMEPSTGDILAMATFPDYNLNTPFTPTDSTILSTWDSLSSEEKNQTLYKMWNNSATQETYEPGSTFKLITAAVGLEEGIVETDKAEDFSCSGVQKVSYTSIRCWKYPQAHNEQTLRVALGNSCNPAFIQLGQRVGAPTLYKYYEAFGLFERTNSVFYGEASSNFWDLEDVTDVELATMSFGQRFKITPLQLVTSVCAIANEGVLVQPQIVKQTVDSSTGAITTTETVAKRQVISKETAETMLDLMEYVVEKGTGQHAKVSGYSVGGKSGTSEPLDGNTEEGYVASFIGVAPVSNPEVVILVAIYDPKGSAGHQGGQVAGPVVSQILSEILPLLDIASSTDSHSNTSSSLYDTTALPDVRNQTTAKAKEILEKAGFKVNILGEIDSSTLVTEQTPKTGVKLLNGANVFLYTENNNVKSSVTVPNFKGMSAAQAINSANSKQLNLVLNGSGVVISQDTPSNSEVEIGSVITLNLGAELDGGY